MHYDTWTQAPKVLMVDDSKENVRILKKMLETLPLELFVAFSGKDVLELTAVENFDLILLDIKMPFIDGFEVCQRLRQMEAYTDVPILFTTSLHAMEDKIRAFEAGGDDYLVKPLFEREVRARVVAHLQHQILAKNLKRLLRQSYHELYNPLAVINSSVELFELKHGENRYIDAISAASKSLELIYKDFAHSFTRTEDERIPINLSAFITERVAYFELMSKVKNIRFEMEVYAQNSRMFISKSDLCRIIDNTLSNAVKYAFPDSVIRVEIRNETDRVLFSCANRGSVIKDTRKIFKEGYRESIQKIGMGIGLELVAHLCALNEIAYEVVSDTKETCFKYLFKISKEEG